MPGPDETSATLAGIRAIEQAATPGEWRHRTAEGRGDWTSGSKTYSIERVEADAIPGGVAIFGTWADAEFAAMARTAFPLLIAALDAAQAALARHQQWFINDDDVKICGGCLEPVPCRDADVIGRALAGKEAGEHG